MIAKTDRKEFNHESVDILVATYRSRHDKSATIGATGLLALALVGGTGGPVGSAVTAVALKPQPAQAALSTTQTIAQTALTTNVAGTVFSAAGPSVVTYYLPKQTASQTTSSSDEVSA